MGMYVKGYVYRVKMIIIAVAEVLASSLLCYGLFYTKLNKVCGQLNSYDSADYSIIYILNYGEGFSNECLYPDTDIQFYQDAEKSQRLTVSGIMREEKASYDLSYLNPLSFLKPGEVCISQNVADGYMLGIGDTIFAEYSYSQKLIPMKVASIMQTEFDYVHPSIDNDVGVVFLGFNENYASSINEKYILFAEKSKADELAIFPQIINEVINKSMSSNYVLYQGAATLIFETLFSVASVILAQIAFFSKSWMLLYRCYLKGMRRFLLSVIPLLERLFFCLLPSIAVQCVTASAIPDSLITKAYRMIPISICGLFCIIMFIIDSLKLRKKGG